MKNDPNAIAMQRYHDCFDSAQYNTLAEFLASNLKTERDDPRVADGLVIVQNAAFELCGHPDSGGAWHALAVFCGRAYLSLHTVDAMRDFLRRFAPDDTRVYDFDATAKAMLIAYRGLDEIRTATSHANGVHGWRGRMAYELLAAVEQFTFAAFQSLAHGDETYIREKLKHGLSRITGALYEGVRHSENPSLYNLRGTYFPEDGNRSS